MDAVTYALSKNKTKKIVEEAITSVETGIQDTIIDGNTITFVFNDGTTSSMTLEKPADGVDGRAITDVYVDYRHNHLMIVFSDGTTQDAGEIPPLQSGASAYEIAVKYGYTGSEEEQLESLKGEEGQKGDSITARVDAITQENRTIGHKITLTSSNPNAQPLTPIEMYNGVSPSVSTEPMADGKGHVVTFTQADPYNIDGGGKSKTIYIYNGEKGEDAVAFKLLGQVDSEADLPSTANENDAYLVGTNNELVVYIWDASTQEWKNVGAIQGVKGEDGSTPIIQLADYDDGQGNTGTKILVTNYLDGRPVAAPTEKIIYNGKDGIDGKDGYNPQCTLIANPNDPRYLDLTVTYKDNVSGEIKEIVYPISQGIDGTSAYITVTQIANGYIFNVRDANNPSGTDYTITNGIDGLSSDIVCTRNKTDDGYDVTFTSPTYPSGKTISLMDGNSVHITTEPINNNGRTGHKVNITDENGTQYINLFDGVSPTLNATRLSTDNGYEITLTDKDGTNKINLYDGISSTIDTKRLSTDNGYEVEITDKNGSKKINLYDGTSSTINTKRLSTNNGYEVEITDKDGTEKINLYDGLTPSALVKRNDTNNGWQFAFIYPNDDPSTAQYKTIPDGVSPTLSSTKTDDGYKVIMTDVNGTQEFVLKNGRNGTGGGTVLSFIVGNEPFAANWLSLESDGEPLVPEEGLIYQVKTSDSEYDEMCFTWDDGNQTYLPITSLGNSTINTDIYGNVGYFQNNSFVPFNSAYKNILPSGVTSNLGTYVINDEEIGYDIFATSYQRLRNDYCAFDGQQDTAWATTQTTDQYVQVTLTKAFQPIRIGLVVGFKSGGEVYNAPTVTLFGSNDNFVTSTQLWTKSGLSIGDKVIEDINLSEAYSGFRIAVSGNAPTGVGITEFQLFERNDELAFKGATETEDGLMGQVLTPNAGQQNSVLMGNGKQSDEKVKGELQEEVLTDTVSLTTTDINTIEFTIDNPVVDRVYRITYKLASKGNIISLNTTNATYTGSAISTKEEDIATDQSFYITPTNGNNITVTANVYTSTNNTITYAVYDYIKGMNGLVPMDSVSDRNEYGTRFYANDGTQKNVIDTIRPFGIDDADKVPIGTVIDRVNGQSGFGSGDRTHFEHTIPCSVHKNSVFSFEMRTWKTYASPDYSNIYTFSTINAVNDSETSLPNLGIQANLANTFGPVTIVPEYNKDVIIKWDLYWQFNGSSSYSKADWQFTKLSKNYVSGIVKPKPSIERLYLANDGEYYGMGDLLNPFAYHEPVYTEKGTSSALDTLTNGSNTVTFTIPNNSTDLVYFKYHTVDTSNIISFSATNATYDTSKIPDYGVEDNLHTDYEIILTPTAESDIVITMTIYSDHTSNTQSYTYGEYVADYYTDGYVIAPREKPETLEYLGSDAKQHTIDTSSTLAEAKEYADEKLVEAKEYSDNNHNDAVEHSDTNYDNAIKHSDQNFRDAKDYTNYQVRGKSFNSNALITPDYTNVLATATATPNVDLTYTATEECVIFFSMVINDDSFIAINDYHLDTYDTYYFLNIGDTFTMNASQGSYTVFGLRNSNVKGRIYQNTLIAVTDATGNIELPITSKVPVHVISAQGHLTDTSNTDNVIITTYKGADGLQYANVNNGHSSYTNTSVTVTYWQMDDYSSSVTGTHIVEFTLPLNEVVTSTILADYPQEYTLAFEESRITSIGEATILQGEYYSDIMVQTLDGSVKLLFNKKPVTELVFAVAVYDSATATKSYEMYSTDEQIVGQQIDGKAIYRKTITDLNIQLSQNNQLFAQTPIYPLIDNVDTLISATAYSFDSNNHFVMPVTILIENGDWSIRGVDTQTITALTIEYTKK